MEKQSLTTIQLVFKQISTKIHQENTELIEARETSDVERKIKNILNLGLDDDGKANFNIIINVLTKIFMVFGKQPFIDQLSLDPLFSYINQI
ncbi:unnamed protein product [Rotaria sordida]|uniref:Uncharacterized protein n=1 Tax=Rotaria sordida TaxID=392033 RepID=A0A815AS89_9BILA|nr:unnamed protein product [Rotaria sordida]CAF4122089.1 unnamed protein product [Rotaria sordida]